jgi:DNA-binding NtrC family response regulator
MESHALVGPKEAELLCETAYGFDWKRNKRRLDVDQLNDVGLFFFFFDHWVRPKTGADAIVEQLGAVLPLVFRLPSDADSIDGEARARLGINDQAITSPEAAIPQIKMLVLQHHFGLPESTVKDDFSQVLGSVFGNDVFDRCVRQALASASSPPLPVERRKLGDFYLRCLLDGPAYPEAFGRNIEQLMPFPGLEKAFNFSGILDAFPELKAPPESRLVPVHDGVEKILEGWRQKSESLAQMGASSRRLALRLGHEAMTDESVLLLGETGTGKELAARAIHQLSERSAQQFLPVNCAGLPETLASSLLFGHRRGSFTGATEHHPGAFVAAKGGTVFLDEVGELSMTNQALLLRTIGERRVLAVGATEETEIDVRLIAATNRDLEAMVEDGSFRADLFYRLRGDWAIQLPALRDRTDSELRETWLALVRQAARSLKIPVQERPIRAADLEAIRARTWGGNVRQLATYARKYVESMRGRDLASDLVSFFDLVDLGFKPTSPGSPHKWPSQEIIRNGIANASKRGLQRTLDELREAIVLTCVLLEGDKPRAAKRLRMKGPALRAYVSRLERKKRAKAENKPFSVGSKNKKGDD